MYTKLQPSPMAVAREACNVSGGVRGRFRNLYMGWKRVKWIGTSGPSVVATQFAILGVGAACIGVVFRLNDLTANGAVEAFRKGAADLLPAALVVGGTVALIATSGGDDGGPGSQPTALPGFPGPPSKR